MVRNEHFERFKVKPIINCYRVNKLLMGNVVKCTKMSLIRHLAIFLEWWVPKAGCGYAGRFVARS